MRYLFTFILFSIALSFANAQELLPFQFSVEQREYKDLENPISLTNDQIWDDPNFTVPLGFDFDFLGQSVSTLNSNDNLSGAMLLAGIGSSDGINMIIPYFSDLQDRGALTNESISEINYEIVGESPNKIAKIEWKNAGFFDEINELFESTSYVNLQLWVYEGSNIIEIIFGPNDVNTKIAHGFGGASLGLVNNLNFNAQTAELVWNLYGNPFDPDISELKNISFDSDPPVFIADPQDGTVFRFTPNSDVSKVEKVEKLNGVEIYPTLVENNFIIDNKSNENIQVQVFNSIGTLILDMNDQNGLQQVNFSDFGPGMYFVNMQKGDLVASHKIVKL